MTHEEYPDFHGDMPIDHSNLKHCGCGTNCSCEKDCNCETCGCDSCSTKKTCKCGCGCNCSQEAPCDCDGCKCA